MSNETKLINFKEGLYSSLSAEGTSLSVGDICLAKYDDDKGTLAIIKNISASNKPSFISLLPAPGTTKFPLVGTGLDTSPQYDANIALSSINFTTEDDIANNSILYNKYGQVIIDKDNAIISLDLGGNSQITSEGNDGVTTLRDHCAEGQIGIYSGKTGYKTIIKSNSTGLTADSYFYLPYGDRSRTTQAVWKTAAPTPIGSTTTPVYVTQEGEIQACIKLFSTFKTTKGKSSGESITLTVGNTTKTITLSAASNSASGVVTTSSQKFAGDKTFFGDVCPGIESGYGTGTVAHHTLGSTSSLWGGVYSYGYYLIDAFQNRAGKMWISGEGTTPAVNFASTAYLELGNGTNYTKSSGSICGIVRLYGKDNSYTDISVKDEGNKNSKFILPAPDSGSSINCYAIWKSVDTAIGDKNKPIYINADGSIVEGDTYAGGTQVTLNGDSMSKQDISIYAPIVCGNENDILISKGENKNPVWIDPDDLVVGKAKCDEGGNIIANIYATKDQLEAAKTTIQGTITSSASDIKTYVDTQVTTKGESTLAEAKNYADGEIAKVNHTIEVQSENLSNQIDASANTVKGYADEKIELAKQAILNHEQLTSTFNKLQTINTWMETHKGEATELIGDLADEATVRQAQDAALAELITDLKSKTISVNTDNGLNISGTFGTGITISNATWLASATAVGDATTPVYALATGEIKTCNKYAGGTSVTLNGASKPTSDIGIYAPEASGTAGEILVSGGSSTTPSWLSILPLANGGTGRNADAYTVNRISYLNVNTTSLRDSNHYINDNQIAINYDTSKTLDTNANFQVFGKSIFKGDFELATGSTDIKVDGVNNLIEISSGSEDYAASISLNPQYFNISFTDSSANSSSVDFGLNEFYLDFGVTSVQIDNSPYIDFTAGDSYITIQNDITNIVTADLSIAAPSITMDGGASITGLLNVDGAVSLGDTLEVADAATFNSNVALSVGNLSIESGYLQFSNDGTYIDEYEINTTAVNINSFLVYGNYGTEAPDSETAGFGAAGAIYFQLI